MNKVRKAIIQNKLIEKGDHVIMGVSGGPDSVCLLSVLWELKDEWDLFLHAVHINHCLRGQDADEDQRYTEGLCRSLGIPCHVFTYDVNTIASELKITTEEAGRKVRYESFDRIKIEIRESYRGTDLNGSGESIKSIESKESIKFETSAVTRNPKVKIAIAHNMNDQAETLLMRIIRGTGTDGLAGMEYCRDDTFIRPLLDVSRYEIEEYCRDRDLHPRIDLSNLEPLYTRNKIRLELLPLLESAYNENILGVLNRLAQIAAEDKSYLYNQVGIAAEAVVLATEDGNRKINRMGYADLHPAIGKRLVTASLKEMGLWQDMAAVHLDGADNLMRLGKTGDRIDFPGGYGLMLTYGYGILYFRDGKRIIKTGKKADITEQISKDKTEQISKDKTEQIPKVKTFACELFPENQMSDSFHMREIKIHESSGILGGILKVKTVQIGQRDQDERRQMLSALTGGDCFKACLDISGISNLADGGSDVRNIVVRTRRPGDHINPLGMKGRKKLQDFFVDNKIPKEDRDNIPLVCFGSEVLWVVGMRISEKYKVTEKTTEMVCIEYMTVI